MKMVKIEFDSGKIVEIPEGQARDLILAYAITGHKSQGSQYKVVVMPISPDHDRMLERTLVYTEWTRTKEKLILVGNRELLEKSVSNVSAGNRRTRLKHFLNDKLNLINGVQAKSKYVDSTSGANRALHINPFKNVTFNEAERRGARAPSPAINRLPNVFATVPSIMKKQNNGSGTQVSEPPKNKVPAVGAWPGGMFRPTTSAKSAIDKEEGQENTFQPKL